MDTLHGRGGRTVLSRIRAKSGEFINTGPKQQDPSRFGEENRDMLNRRWFRSLWPRPGLVGRQAWRERGFAQLIVLAGGAAITAGVLIVGEVGIELNKTMASTTATREAYARSEQLEVRLVAESASSKAVWTPAIAVDGAANCDGLGRCRELDLLSGTSATDGQHAAFTAYLAGATGGVQRYTYSDTNAGAAPSGLVADGKPIGGSGLYFRQVPVTALAADPDTTATTKAAIASLGITPKRWTFQYEHAGVVASNDVFYVHYDPGTGPDVFALSVKVKPLTNFTVVNGIHTPPPVPPIDYAGQGGSLVFPYPSASSQAFTVHETLYHDAFAAAGSCNMGGTTISTTSPTSALPNPNPMSPPNQDSGPATFTMAPASAGLCSELVQDVYNQTIVETVQVMGPLQLSKSSTVLSIAAGSHTDTIAASKTYDATGVSLSFSGCAGIASAAQGAQTVPGTPSASPASSTAFSITAIGSGFCDLSVHDQYGETQVVHINVYGSLVVSPGSLSFASSTAPAQSYSVHEDVYRGVFLVADNCGGAITDSVSSGGGSGTDSTYSVAAARNNVSCAISVSDDHGNTGTVTVSILNGSLVAQYVCDPQSPARPFNTDIGPDPDGIHEDFSNGSSCAGPTPSSQVVTSSVVGPIDCDQPYLSQWDCYSEADLTFSFTLASTAPASLSFVGSWSQNGTTSVYGNNTCNGQYWCGNPYQGLYATIYASPQPGWSQQVYANVSPPSDGTGPFSASVTVPTPGTYKVVVTFKCIDEESQYNHVCGANTTGAGQIVETQSFSVTGYTTDSDLFILYADGSTGEGTPVPGAVWACITQNSMGVPSSGGGVWGGFNYNGAIPSYLSTRYFQMYQEAMDNGGSGNLSAYASVCPAGSGGGYGRTAASGTLTLSQ
jgi:hypothetical protein